jgi:hypothetical protein
MATEQVAQHTPAGRSIPERGAVLVRLAIEDVVSGETDRVEIHDGWRIVLCGGWYVSYEQRFANQTTQLTLKYDPDWREKAAAETEAVPS